MADSRLARCRALYALDVDPGNDVPDGPPRPMDRCICGSAVNEPHWPACYRYKVEQEHEPDEPGYGAAI